MNKLTNNDLIVAKYTRVIHPRDLGDKTKKLENTLYAMLREYQEINNL